MSSLRLRHLFRGLFALACISIVAGCGTMGSNMANRSGMDQPTEQLDSVPAQRSLAWLNLDSALSQNRTYGTVYGSCFTGLR